MNEEIAPPDFSKWNRVPVGGVVPKGTVAVFPRKVGYLKQHDQTWTSSKTTQDMLVGSDEIVFTEEEIKVDEWWQLIFQITESHDFDVCNRLVRTAMAIANRDGIDEEN